MSNSPRAASQTAVETQRPDVSGHLAVNDYARVKYPLATPVTKKILRIFGYLEVNGCPKTGMKPLIFGRQNNQG